MTKSGNHDQRNHTAREPWRWTRMWPKVKIPVRLIAGQLIGWVLRRWLG